LRPHTYQTLFALLACTGLRVSEAIRLRCQDFTPDGLMVRESKFRKSRLVPLHRTARAGVERYVTRRHWMRSRDDPLFVSHRGRPVPYSAARTAFRTALQTVRVDASPSRRRPTLHCLRHTFAVRALEACPGGRDRIARHTVALSTYLGHSTLAATYWYLEATPHLLRDIAEACERFFKGETS
jgi:integrase